MVPSVHVERQVLTALNSPPRARRQPGIKILQWATVSAAVCAGVGIIAFEMPKGRTPKVAPSASASASSEKPFTAVPYVIPPAPYERTTVVRTRVSLQMMLMAGFDIPQENIGMSAPADVLYGEDGRMLAIRLLSDSNNISEKRMD